MQFELTTAIYQIFVIIIIICAGYLLFRFIRKKG